MVSGFLYCPEQRDYTSSLRPQCGRQWVVTKKAEKHFAPHRCRSRFEYPAVVISRKGGFHSGRLTRCSETFRQVLQHRE
jgi:hypothetical protein